MSDAKDHPVDDPAEPGGKPVQGGDPDAWATACEEDLAAEQSRRRERYGPQPGDAAQELRRLADAVTEQLGKLGAGFGAGAVAAPLAAQARAALEPVIERNAEVFQHLAAAGQELFAAYRAAAGRHESEWSRPAGPEADDGPGDGPDDDPGDASGHPQRIDLD
jgi:uncharacterized protein DUF5304